MAEDETLEQELTKQLREIAKAIKAEPLHEAATGIAGALTATLGAVVSDDPVCSVLVTLGEDTLMEDWLVHPDVPAAVLFEMGGRLQSIALRLIAMASHREAHEQEDAIDHTGHGCRLDPTLKAGKTPLGVN